MQGLSAFPRAFGGRISSPSLVSIHPAGGRWVQQRDYEGRNYTWDDFVEMFGTHAARDEWDDAEIVLNGEVWEPDKTGWAPPEGSAPKHAPVNPLTLKVEDLLAEPGGVARQHLDLTNRLMLHGCSRYCLKRWKRIVTTVVQWVRACRLYYGWRDPETGLMTGQPLHTKVAHVLQLVGGSPRYDGPRDHPRHIVREWDPKPAPLALAEP